jgi:two-component system, sensor histidine kinase ChiS
VPVRLLGCALLVLGLGAVSPVLSQQEGASLELQARGHWRTYGVTDGLGGLDVWSIFRDRDGDMWFATEGGGVSRFDGDTWTSFDVSDGLVDNSVYEIVQDVAGDLWFRSRRGVSRYDGLTWRGYTEQADGLAPSTGYHPTVLATDSNGSIWYGSNQGGLSRFDGNRWTTVDSVNGHKLEGITSATQTRDGAMWFGTSNGAVRYQDDDWHLYGTMDGLASSHVYSVASDSSGTVWFGTQTGVSHFDHGTWTTHLVDFETSSLLCATDGDVWAATGVGTHRFDGNTWELGISVDGPRGRFFEDAHGDIWYSSGANGVLRHGRTGVRAYGMDGRLPHQTVVTIAEDLEGRLWFGTPGGVSRYDGAEWLTFGKSDGLPHNAVRSLLETRDGAIWFGTDAGVSRYDGAAWRHFTSEDGLPPGRVWDLAQDRSGRIWLTARIFGARGSAIASFDKTMWQGEPTEIGPVGTQVYDVFEDRAGDLWFGTNAGAYRVHRAPGYEDTYSTFDTSDGLGDDYAARFAQDLAGNIWLGTATGASRYDGTDWTHYTTADGMARGTVRAILADTEGRVWFGSDGYGVSVFDGESFHTVTTTDGLAHNSLRSMMQDRHGHIWFGTDAGLVSRYDGEVFQTLTAEDGLTGQSVRAMMQDRKGDIWFATYGGIARFRQPPDRPPTVAIDAVVADQRYAEPAVLSVPSTTKLIVFEFHGASFRTRPNGMVYRYRLQGFDADWRTTGARRVEYADLPAGDYFFEIVAVDRDLLRSAPAVVAIEIHAPYERFAWISALSLALLLVAFQGTRIVRRDRRLIEANRQIEAATRNKSQFLRRMSHDLRSPMNAIIGYTRIVLRRAGDQLDPRQVRNLQNIHTSADNLLNLINDILDLSRIEAGRIELTLQPVDVRTLASECADSLESIVGENVVLRRDLADVGLVHSDPDRLRQVIMNLIGNATKFTESGSITLSLRSDADDTVVLSIADTGIGIPAADLPHIFDEFRQVERQGGEAAEGTGLGLAIARKTVELLGGELSATSDVGVGTTFIVRLSVAAPIKLMGGL